MMQTLEDGLRLTAQEHKRSRSSRTIRELRGIIRVALANHMEINEIASIIKMPERFVQRIANERTR